MSLQHFFYRTAVCPCCPTSTTQAAHLIRRDARVYLNGYPATEAVRRRSGTCVGVVWTTRPLGADAGPRAWGPTRPDRELEQVLKLFTEAHRHQTSESPSANSYIQVLHLCHIPIDESSGDSAAPWKCSYAEKIPVVEKPRILIAAWGLGHAAPAIDKARCTIRDLLDRGKWDSREMLFFIQDIPPCSRPRDAGDSRLILPRPPEELLQPAAWTDPSFQSQLPDLAYSLKTYIVGPGADEADVMGLDQ